MVKHESRVITIRPATVLAVLGIAVLVGLVLILLYLAWQVLTWILVSVILACALNPAVESFERRGMGRGVAAGIVFTLALLVMTGVGFLVIPPLVTQVSDFVVAVPDFIDDLTRGRGPLGWLQDDYQIVDRIREAIDAQGPGGVLGLSLPVLDLVRSVVTAVVAVVTIIFLTFFMLLDGARWRCRASLGLRPDRLAPAYERVVNEHLQDVSGYVTGNLLISLVAGVSPASRAVRGRQCLRGRPWAARGGARSHTARRRHAGRDHRL